MEDCACVLKYSSFAIKISIVLLLTESPDDQQCHWHFTVISSTKFGRIDDRSFTSEKSDFFSLCFNVLLRLEESTKFEGENNFDRDTKKFNKSRFV